MIRPALMILIVVPALLSSGCSFPDSARDKAAWFFDKGADRIVDSLADQGVGHERLKQVETVLADHRSAVVADLAAAFSAQRDSFGTLLSGAGAQALLDSEERLHGARRTALHSIGAMHADLEAAVGSEAWAAAGVDRRERFEAHTGG